ncbi:MAG: glycosyltransferase [Chitinophagaceae bacterium]
MVLSVCMITYNQENFITQAIESVLMQRCDFDFELIIGEDNSTDTTRKICELYQEKYPAIIKLLPASENMGMLKNFLRSYKACNGKYIAFLEGDDYWTDAAKLQKQVNFLTQNNEYSICFHNVIMKFQRANENAEKPFHANLTKYSFETEDLLKQWFIPSASVVFVNYPDFVFPDWFVNCKSGDIPFLLLMSLRGKINYINEIMSVYRIHDSGISSTHRGYDKIIAMIFIYENFNSYTNYKFHQRIREAIIYEIEYHLPQTKPVNKEVVVPIKGSLRLFEFANKIKTKISGSPS